MQFDARLRKAGIGARFLIPFLIVLLILLIILIFILILFFGS